MYKKYLLIVLSFCFLSFAINANNSLLFSSNLLFAAGEDTLEAKAREVVKEAEKIFKETEEGQVEERRSRISQFTSKVTKTLSLPFTKTLTKVTLIQMELVCSAMPDLESAGFGTFPQSFILLEVLGKEHVDSELLIKGLANKGNDWKFRTLIAEIIGNLELKEAKDAMMKIILDKSDNKSVRGECMHKVPKTGDTFKGKLIGEYLLAIFKDEKELRAQAARPLGYLKYEQGVDILLEHVEKSKDVNLRIVMVRALGNIGDKTAIPRMFSLLKDKKIRAFVAEQLGRIGGEEVVDTLIRIVENDKDSFVQYLAAKGLALTEDNKAYKFLIERKETDALGSAAWEGRKMRALDALKEIGTPEAIEELRRLSLRGRSVSPEIREKAKVLLRGVENEKD